MITIKVTFIPMTKPGKYSVLFAFAYFLLLDILYIFRLHEEPMLNEKVWLSALVAVIVLCAFTLSAVSLIMGYKSIKNSKERSVLVVICILIDIFALFYVIVQVIS